MSTEKFTTTARTSLLVVAAVFVMFVLAFGPPAMAAQTDSSSEQSQADQLTIADAAILGLVEGLTEYLPVSSTGHLLVATKILGLGGTPESDRALETYAICIQAGAILAVVFLYQNRIRQMIDGLLGRDPEGRRLLIAVISAFIPTAIIAASLFDTVRERIFGSVGWIAAAWVIGGVVILVLNRNGFFDRAGSELTEITSRQAVAIGLMQAIAIWPGVSRSLVTIIAGVLVGLNLRASVEFSFLLGLITLSAATVYEGIDGGGDLIATFGYTAPLVGLLVAFVSAVAAVRWMVDWLQQRGFEIFGWYRIVIGCATGAAVAAGWL